MRVCINRCRMGTVRLEIGTRNQVFGGAPLNKEVGDNLARQGVALLSAYGWYDRPL